MSTDQITDIRIDPTYIELVESVFKASRTDGTRRSRLVSGGDVVMVEWRWVNVSIGGANPVASVEHATHIQIINAYCDRLVSGPVALRAARISFPQLIPLPR